MRELLVQLTYIAAAVLFILGLRSLTRPGEANVVGGVTILGPVNIASTLPYHASQMLSRNVLTLLQHLSTKEGALQVDVGDEITGAMAVTHAGEVRHT